MPRFVDTAALAIEVLRAAGVRAELNPPADETAETPLVVVQDASPVWIRNGPVGAATNTVISLSVVARDREQCAATADAAVTALTTRVGEYTEGRLVRGIPTNLPRPVNQNVIAGDNIYQRHAMVKIIAMNTTL